jgi:membrane-bound lytic murein transglycosylase D
MTDFLRILAVLLLSVNVLGQYSFPDEIIFAGQKVPLDKYDVKERLTNTFNTFTLDRRGFIQNLINKSNEFIPYAKEILKQWEIHEDFAYIMPVESEFDPRALSQAKASGPWQLMPATAKMYGLRVDDFADDRNLLDRSTKAAVEHLSMLSQVLKNDPFLMIAAYNNGDSNVRNMVQGQKTAGFWEARSNFETEFYVEKVIIYKLLMTDPEKYGFSKPEKKPDREYEMCTLSMGSNNLYFTEICAILGIPYRELYKINAHIKFGSYKSGGYISKYTSIELMVPKNSSQKLISELRKKNFLSGSPESPVVSSVNKSGGLKEDIYEIRYNDNIESIAFKYGVDWRKVAESNNLKIVTLPSGIETAELNKGQKIRIQY